jgi:hypothetical protein
MNINELLNNFVLSPNDVENNFSLARYYHDIGQTASAVSYYIRTAERTDDLLLRYECLLHAANCFEKQGTRRFTVKGILQQAISILPNRPEAYYLLSKLQEYNESNEGRYLDSYTMCSIALQVCDFVDLKPLRFKVEYPGKYAIMFQKATMGWWNGLQDETKSVLLDLYTNYEMSTEFYTAVRNNLINLGAFYTKKIVQYDKNKFDKLKVKFKDSETIERNYSEAYQDMFVLSALNGKKKGTYVEIGSGHPTYGNNTYLLEKDFEWSGLSIDLSDEFIQLHKKERKHTSLLKDATLINYDSLLTSLDMDTVIDYLQIDVDPADVSLNVLISIPFEKYKFGVITFEHDHYADPKSDVRRKSRAFLQSHGYMLVGKNISPDENRPYEDWYIHPDLIDINTISNLITDNEETKMAEKFILAV